MDYDRIKMLHVHLDYQSNLIKLISTDSGDTVENRNRLSKVQNKIEELLEIK